MEEGWVEDYSSGRAGWVVRGGWGGDKGMGGEMGEVGFPGGWCCKEGGGGGGRGTWRGAVRLVDGWRKGRVSVKSRRMKTMCSLCQVRSGETLMHSLTMQ